jgi:hypothetical protein
MALSMEQMTQQMSRARQQKPDPNQKIYEALSPSAKRAYERALYGPPMTTPVSGQVQNFKPRGCQNVPDPSQKIFEALGPKLEDLYKRIQADPRTRSMERAWSSCMKSKGYTVTSRNDLFQNILGPEQNKLFSALNSQAGATSAAVQVTQVPPTIPPKKLAEFKKFELKLSGADLDCTPENDAKVMKDIQTEYEQAFLRDNGAAITKAKNAG